MNTKEQNEAIDLLYKAIVLVQENPKFAGYVIESLNDMLDMLLAGE